MSTPTSMACAACGGTVIDLGYSMYECSTDASHHIWPAIDPDDDDDDDYEDDDWDYEEEDDEDNYGVCDSPKCNFTYRVEDSTTHCPVEGMCWDHCTDQVAHNPVYEHMMEVALDEVL